MRVSFGFVVRIAPPCMLLAAALLFPASAPAARTRPRHTPQTHHPEPAPAPVSLSAIRVFGGRPAPFALEAKSALLVDARTGTELYAFNEHEKMQPASLAKIMTFYLTLAALRQGRIAMDTPVPISEAAWRLSMNDTVSRMFLGVGQKVPVRDLLYGLMVSSGNDAAVALAEYLGPTAEAFTEKMNEQAAQLGLLETHFANPDGLPLEGEYTTAADMVKLGRDLLAGFPDATEYTGAKDYTFDKITQRNFNTLLFYDSRVDGIKTGHVDEAGFHLVASARSQGMLLISAVMGTRNMEKRRTETEKLLDWAFRTFATVHPDGRKAAPQSIAVYQGVADQVALAPQSDCWITVERGKEAQVTVSYAPSAKYLDAPVGKGAVAGQMIVMQGSTQVAAIPVVAQSAVARAGFIKRLGDWLSRRL